MDALVRPCIADLVKVASFPSPLRRRRSCSISTPFPTIKMGSGSIVLLPTLRPPSTSYSPHCVASSCDSVPLLRDPVFFRACLVLSAAFVPSWKQADELTPDSPVGMADSSKTLRVRFVLQKECAFGQQYFLVGDDPTFGIWDPLKAIPLEWSAGHLWTAELDLPIGRQFLFKFILKGLSGEISWQPGPDRSLQTWETTKTIVISEDWDKAEDQKVTEEEVQMPIVVEEAQPSNMNIDSSIEVAMDLTQFSEAPDKLIDIINGASSERIEGNLLLVPGLASVSASENAFDSPQEIMVPKVDDASFTADEAELCNSSQMAMDQTSGKENASGLSHGNVQEEKMLLSQQLKGDESEEIQSTTAEKILPQQSDSESTADVEMLLSQQLKGDESEEIKSTAVEKILPQQSDSESTADVVQNDIQWGHRILKQFLIYMGFSLPPTEIS